MAKVITTKGKEVSAKAVKQKLELSAAKLKAEQQGGKDQSQAQGNAGEDRIEDDKAADSKADKVDGRKINLSKFVKGDSGQVSVTLKFSDPDVVDKFKLSAKGAQVDQGQDKLIISGESADVREVLQNMLFQPGANQNSFRIDVEVNGESRSIKSSLSFDFSHNEADNHLSFSVFENESSSRIALHEDVLSHPQNVQDRMQNAFF